jgi:hypothetical protein
MPKLKEILQRKAEREEKLKSAEEKEQPSKPPGVSLHLAALQGNIDAI